METPLLNGVAGGDYEAVRSLKQAREMFWKETVKLWRIGGPIAFTILCQYGTNSLTTIFVGHIGDIKLSSVSISLSVIGTFSFGFLLIFSFWVWRAWFAVQLWSLERGRK